MCQTYSDFFNWNKVKIRYCDGASFAGQPKSEVRIDFTFDTNLYIFGFIYVDVFYKHILYSREEVSCCSEARSYGKLLSMNSYQLAYPKQSRLYFYNNNNPIYLLKFSELVSNK